MRNARIRAALREPRPAGQRKQLEFLKQRPQPAVRLTPVTVSPPLWNVSVFFCVAVKCHPELSNKSEQARPACPCVGEISTLPCHPLPV